MQQTMKVKGIDMFSLVSAVTKNRRRENFKDDELDDDEVWFAKLGIGVIIALILFNLALWIYGLMLLLKHKDTMPTWAVVLAIFGLIGFFIPMGPLATIVIVLVTKNTK